MGVPILLLIGIFLNWWYAGGFLLGAIASATAGFVGMNVSVRANVRVAQATRGPASARPSPCPSRAAR